ncbi:MAG: response regulator [Verrucomicrobiaceae bacterium]
MSANLPAAPPRVLVADASLSNRRLIREALTAFRHCEVDDAASAEHAYERALQREYLLFIFALTLPDMSGAMLDRLLARVYPRLHPGSLTAPAIIYLTRPEEASAFHDLQRDARVRGSVPLPLNLDALLTATTSVLPMK